MMQNGSSHVGAQAVFMLGVHRSGTSALSRVLNLMGVELGNDLLPPAADNELGFWEHREISHIHDRILEVLGREWWAVAAFPPQWWQWPQFQPLGRQLLEVMQRDFGQSRLWGLKDPRLCFLLPLWRSLFQDDARFKCVLIVRNPAEVARSLGKRDAMSPARVYSLWLRSMIEAERSSRGLTRILISYPALLDNWPLQVQRIGTALNIVWPSTIASAAPAVAEFIRPGLRHHALTDQEFLNDATVPAQIRHAYAAALQAVASGDLEPLSATLDDLDRELAQAPAICSQYLSELERQHRAATEAAVVQQRKLQAETQTQLRAAQAEQNVRAAEQTAQCVQLQAAYNAMREELREAYQVRDTLGGRLRTLFQSWTWWSSKPVRMLTQWLGAGRIQSTHLVPLVNARRNSQGHWEGEGLPRFVIPVMPLRGWVHVLATVKSSVASRACVYFDTGSGFNEAERADLGAVSGTTVIDRIIPVRSTAYLARFDPLRHYGNYEIIDFAWQPLGRWAALAILLRRTLRAWAATGHRPRPSLRRGIQLLLSGRFDTFYKQLLTMAQIRGEVSAYDSWLQQHQITDAFRAQMRKDIASWQNPPTLSLILPVYNVPEIYLRKCIDSVLRQGYPHWELCIADDASSLPHVKPLLQEYAAREPRIKVAFRASNGNISAASNAALELATGDYIALLDHDDEIAEHALYRMAQAIVADPTLDMIYSDEDKMTSDGRQLDPFFKPDWSPDYFLSCMYTCHLGVYRTALIRQVGGWRSAFDGAQDYDLVLRLLITNPRIHHIPEILYHWRMLETSTASGAGAKPTAHLRARAAIEQYLAAINRPAILEDGPAAGFHAVHYKVVGKPRVSIIIPSACKLVDLDGANTYMVLNCAKSIGKSSYDNIEIIVVDRNDMPRELETQLKDLGVRRQRYDFPFNWSAVNNHGAAAATGDYLLFLNDDTEVISPDWLERLLGYAQWPEVGAVGGKLLFGDGTLQHTGVCLPGGNPTHPFYGYPGAYPGYYFSNDVPRNWIAVTGACMLTRAQVFREVGEFDETLPLNYNDVEYCLRLQDHNYRVVYVPSARLYHLESKTRKSVTRVEEIAAMRKLWNAKYRWDPYYNPNLATDSSDFRIDPMAGAVGHLTARIKPPVKAGTPKLLSVGAK